MRNAPALGGGSAASRDAMRHEGKMKKKLVLLAFGVLCIFGAYSLALPLWAYLPGIVITLFALAWIGAYNSEGDRKYPGDDNGGHV